MLPDKVNEASGIKLGAIYFDLKNAPSSSLSSLQSPNSLQRVAVFCFRQIFGRSSSAALSEPAAKMRHPTTKWAQRSDKVYVTIELPDAKDVKLDLQPEGRFTFSATSGRENTPYEINFELFDKVNVEESKAAVGLRSICYLIQKDENKWWSRLLKQAGKPPVFLKVDWDKWVDEDEETEDKFGGDMDFGGMDFSKLGMNGANDFEGDDDFADKDGDEDDLEEADNSPPADPKDSEEKA